MARTGWLLAVQGERRPGRLHRAPKLASALGPRERAWRRLDACAPAGPCRQHEWSTLTASTALRAPADGCKASKVPLAGVGESQHDRLPEALSACCTALRRPPAPRVLPSSRGRPSSCFAIAPVTTGRHDPCSTAAGTTQRTCLCSNPSLGQHSSLSPSAQQPSPGSSPGAVDRISSGCLIHHRYSYNYSCVAAPNPLCGRQRLTETHAVTALSRCNRP
jgi:hypothetical protein